MCAAYGLGHSRTISDFSHSKDECANDLLVVLDGTRSSISVSKSFKVRLQGRKGELALPPLPTGLDDQT